MANWPKRLSLQTAMKWISFNAVEVIWPYPCVLPSFFTTWILISSHSQWLRILHFIRGFGDEIKYAAVRNALASGRDVCIGMDWRCIDNDRFAHCSMLICFSLVLHLRKMHFETLWLLMESEWEARFLNVSGNDNTRASPELNVVLAKAWGSHNEEWNCSLSSISRINYFVERDSGSPPIDS